MGSLTAASEDRSVFAPEEMTDLPEVARRFLGSALSPGAEVAPTVQLEMEGEIKLKDWIPLRGRQVVTAGEGFVWEVGGEIAGFKGADTHWKGKGSLDFRLWGLIPVVRASGPDVDRSSASRLGVETVAWVPQALHPPDGSPVAWGRRVHSGGDRTRR